MLSLQRVRKLLGNQANLSDSNVELLREQLYVIADVVCENARTKGPTKQTAATESALVAANSVGRSHEMFETLVSTFLPTEREEVEERAAILEYDGGLSRADAERMALAEFCRRKEDS